MPEEIRRKGKHLTWEERQVIQRGLREHRTFTEIAIIIGCSADTISKEIRNHRYHKPHDNNHMSVMHVQNRGAVSLISICITRVMQTENTEKN